MTDEQALESTQEQPEVVEQPVLRVPSASSEDKPPSKPTAGADELERLEALVEQVVSRQQQSLKDKRIAKLEKQLEALAGGEAVSPPDPGRSQVAERGNDTEAYMQAVTAQILDGAGVAYDDPEYIALVEQYGSKIKDPERWEKVVEKFAERKSSKVAKQESVTPAAKVAAPGGIVAEADSVESLANRLEEIRATGKASVDPLLKEERAKIIARLNELEPQVKLGIS